MKNKDLPLWLLVNKLLRKYATAFILPLSDIQPIRKRDHGRVLATCSKRGRIRIDLRDAGGKRHNAYDYIDTIAHELAHLKYQNHSAAWFELHVQILHLMRVNGEYQKIRRALKKRHV